MPANPVGSRLVVAGLVITGVLLSPFQGYAHPLGNFSVNHYSGIVVQRDVIEVRYFIDMAEIPTFQEVQETGIVPEPGHAGLAPYLARKAEGLREGVHLEVNGRRLELSSQSTDVVFPPGAGGLPTMKVGIVYRAKLEDVVPGRPNRLDYRDDNFPGRAGWKEIVATGGRGVEVVASTVSAKDRSRELADYPTDLLQSPPQDLEAHVDFQIGGPSPVVARVSPRVALPSGGIRRPPSEAVPAPVAAEPAKVGEPVRLRPVRAATPRSAFTELVATKELGFWVVLAAVAVAAGLGAFHALEPGHGKTVVAAYLVGSRGTAWHAALLGLTVTASHTAGVYLLGAVTLYASRYVVPERLYPWLGAISGLMIAALGGFLLLRRYAGDAHRPDHSHHHHDHGHLRHGAGHDHSGPSHHHHGPTGTVSLRELIALGVTGGIVPCPAALVVLLSALSLHRVGFGLVLIVAFSVGLAVALISVGLLVVYARRFTSRFHGAEPLVTRWLPLSSAAVITVLGVVIAARSLITAGILRL